MKKLSLGPQTLLYPMPAVLVGAIVDGKPNFLTAAWCGIACRKPPAVAVAVHQGRYTLQGIREKRGWLKGWIFAAFIRERKRINRRCSELLMARN